MLRHRYINLLTPSKSMIHLLIFDLDDTLFDNTGLLSGPGNALAAKAMVEAGLPASWQEVVAKRLAFMQELGPLFDEINMAICRVYGVTDKAAIEKICHGAAHGYNAVDVSGITLFPGARQMLQRLKKKYPLVLISTGIEELQHRKIKELGIEDFFDFICITDGKTSTKSSCLRQALEMYHFSPSQICVVGDRIDSEIRYGNELGMVTVQLVHGKYSVLTPKDKFEKPQYQIKNITDVEKLAEEIE